MNSKLSFLVSAYLICLSSPAFSKTSISLKSNSEQLLSFSLQKLNYANCAFAVGKAMALVDISNPTLVDTSNLEADSKDIIKNLWLSRLGLKNNLHQLASENLVKRNSTNDSCVIAIRRALVEIRFLEDYLAETQFDVKAYVDKVDPKKLIPTLTGENPWLLTAPQHPELRLRSGDILISRGNAFTSAAIGRSFEVDTSFSHLMVVYAKDAKPGQTFSVEEAANNPNIFALEAFIELGSSIRPLKKYLEDGNARNMVFRFHDATVAHLAAKHTYDFIQKKTAERYSLLGTLSPLDLFHDKSHPNFNVPYDFRVDLKNHDSLNCVETGSMGFKSQNVTLPYFPSMFEPKDKNPMVKLTNPLSLVAFNPADMELDPRFEVLAEWRDLRKVGALRIRNAILTAMFSWATEKNYKFRPTTSQNGQALLGALLREFDFVTKKMPKNMSPQLARLVIVLTKTAEILEKEILAQEANFSAANSGLKFSHSQILQRLEKFRSDKELSKELHLKFHP